MEKRIQQLEEPFIPKDETKNVNKDTYRQKIIYITVFCIFTLLVDYLFGQVISEFSFSLQESLDKDKNCALLKTLSITGSFQAKIIIFLVILNFKDMYVAFVYMYLMSLSVWLNGNLKLIYQDTRPYWLAQTLTPCSCVVNFGKPSTHSLNAIIIFLTLWESFCTRKVRKLYPVYSYIFLFFCIIMTLFNGIIKFLQNVHSIDQLLLGYMIGFGFHYIFFYIIEIDFDNPKEFMKYFKSNMVIVLFIVGNIALFFLHIIIHLALDFPVNEQWKAGMMRFCKPYIHQDWFDYESYQKACQLFLPLGVYIGALIEYRLMFSSVSRTYFKYNFCEENSWNKTHLWKIIIRLVYMFIAYYPFSLLFNLSSPEYSLWHYLLTGFIIPDFIIGINSLLISRYACMLLFLNNETYSKNEKASLYDIKTEV